MSMSRWIPCAVVLALLALAAGMVAGARARPDIPAPVSPRVDPAHPPVAFGGPDGRRALDGAWVVSARRGGSDRRVHVPYSPNAGALTKASYAGAVAWYRTHVTVSGGRY